MEITEKAGDPCLKCRGKSKCQAFKKNHRVGSPLTVLNGSCTAHVRDMYSYIGMGQQPSV